MNNNKELSSLINYWEDQLSKWEREYRLFGPKGEIAKHQTGFTKTDLNGLRSRINKLYRWQKQLNSTVEDREGGKGKTFRELIPNSELRTRQR